MGYEKLVTLAEKCAKYAQVCGKRSILETKPIGKVDFSKLGVCLSDGTIRFQSEEAALEYAKNISMQSLKFPISKQFERGCATEGCDVLEVLNGTHRNINFRDSKVFSFQNRQADIRKTKTKVYTHSHPAFDEFGNTTPVSPGFSDGDTALLGQSNVKKVIAYNMRGEYSSVEALTTFTQDLLTKFCNEYKLFMAKQFFPQETVNRFIELTEQEVKSWRGECEKLSRELQLERYTLKGKIESIFKDNFLSKHYKEMARYTHEFWVENAEKYGMKYTTDMAF